MFPLGHLGFTLAAARLTRRRVPAVRALPGLWLAIGALLPDAVDKPVGWLVLGWDVGRLWGHTLLFASLLAIVALALRRSGAARATPIVAALAVGSFAHLVLDRMWELPVVLLWPALGVAMPREEPSALLQGFHLDAYLVATELAGAALLAWVAMDARAERRHGGPASARMDAAGDPTPGERRAR